MGAADYIGKPYKSSIVLARVKTHLNLKRMADGLRRDSLTDGLTGLPNGRHFDQSLEREWRIAERAAEPMSLLLIDVDHFQAYNDRYGHPKGDACLRRLSQVFLSVVQRPSDLVARCGGKEFVVLLPKTAREGAQHVAHRVLNAVAASAIFHRDAPPPAHHVTVSIGIACHDSESPGWQASAAQMRDADRRHSGRNGTDLVLAADRALHAAKHAGRARAALRDIGDARRDA
jgi:diguanylate cyclase (GGDEF)-like protein